MQLSRSAGQPKGCAAGRDLNPCRVRLSSDCVPGNVGSCIDPTEGVELSDNRIVVRSAEGADAEVESYPGLEVTFQRTGSTVVIHADSVFTNAKILTGTESSIEFARTHPRGVRNTTIDMRGGIGAHVSIGENSSIESARIAMANEDGCTVSIGAHCLISSNIEFRATDGHVMFDLSAPDEVINRTRPIVIGDHVWIGSGAVFMKGSAVANDSVVATRAVVSKWFDEPNSVLAGVPAVIVKKGIGWSREYISRY